MKNINFTEVDKGSYFEYHLPCRDGLLDNSLFYNEFKLNNEVLLLWNQYLWDSGITYLGSNENSLLYAQIIKILSSTNYVDIVSFGNFESDHKYLSPLKSTKIEWNNSIEFTSNDKQFCRHYGYQTPVEFLNEMDYFNKDLTNRGFSILRVNLYNLNAYIKTYHSDVTSWSFYINSDWDGLTSILQNSSKRPSINQMLNFSECIIDLQIGEDEGYSDYVLIRSKSRLHEKIPVIQKALLQFGKAYENLISELGIIDNKWKIEFFKTQLNKISAPIDLL